MASDLNYTTYISQIATLTAISSADPNFQTIMPATIDYAEQRIYREGDFLSTYITDTTANVVANVREFEYPGNNTFLVIDQISILTPITASTSNATRVPLQVASRQFIDMVYPNSATAVGVPAYFAQVTDDSCLLGPVPDQSYTVEMIGTKRPLALSTFNSSTFLTLTLPDLFIAASMIFMSGYMRNFGSQADDAPMATSWQSQYDKLFASAGMEEQRKKYGSQAWQSQIPNPFAQRV